LVASLALVVSGCSSRPRYFVATLNPPAADSAAFEQNMTICRALVGRGYKSDFKAQAAAIGLGTVATGAMIGAAQASILSATVTNLFGGTASTAGGSALAAAAPIVGIALGFGLSRAIRSGREKKLKRALSDCLSEYGHTVEAWTPTKRPKAPGKGESAVPPIVAPAVTLPPTPSP
jgi:hypothetical protein